MTDIALQRQAVDRQRRIAEQAASWYLDQREGLDASGQARFLAWLRHSPAHLTEYLAIARLHGDLAAAAALDPLDGEQLVELAASKSPVVPLRLSAQAAPSPLPAQPRHWSHRLIPAAAAAMVLLLGGAAFLRPPEQIWSAYCASADALRNVALSDGSLLQLDRDSIVAVRFEAQRRRIDVLRGGALFDVAHDPARPLFVQLGANVLQDIGTVFDAHQDDSGGRITVISGEVQVRKKKVPTWLSPLDSLTTGQTIADLGAGQQARMRQDGSLDVLDRQADLALNTAWLPADIHFERASVGDVARRFNAYSARPLLIDDHRIAATRISGRFHARDMEAFIAYLSTLPGVHVVRGAHDIRVLGETASANKPRRL
jgi:transmembrane sensor